MGYFTAKSSTKSSQFLVLVMFMKQVFKKFKKLVFIFVWQWFLIFFDCDPKEISYYTMEAQKCTRLYPECTKFIVQTAPHYQFVIDRL